MAALGNKGRHFFCQIFPIAALMKHLLVLLASLLLVPSLTAQQAEKKVFTPAADLMGSWGFKPDPTLPNVLILGDSISIGYTRAVRAELAGKANVFRPMQPNGKAPVNCGDTEMGLAGLETWLAGQEKWSVIHCNWGLWDLCYRIPGKAKAGNRNKEKGTISLTTEQYAANLEKILTRLQATGAKVIWANTTYVPEGEPGRVAGDELRYNAVAAAIAGKLKIPINDLHATTQAWDGKFSTARGDVHFTEKGSAMLGKQVAQTIRPLVE
jgi:hypothetical protein